MKAISKAPPPYLRHFPKSQHFTKVNAPSTRRARGRGPLTRNRDPPTYVELRRLFSFSLALIQRPLSLFHTHSFTHTHTHTHTNTNTHTHTHTPLRTPKLGVRCLAATAHVRQSWPDSGLDFQVKVLEQSLFSFLSEAVPRNPRKALRGGIQKSIY